MLVGRESELALLVERLEEGYAVAVLGEAGVGKTTLVRAAAEREGARLVEAGSLATLSWLPYLPLRRAFGRDFEGDAAYVAAAVQEELGDGLLFMDDLQWADPQTASLLPLLAGRVSLVAAIRRGDSGTPEALEMAGGAGLELLPLEPLPDQEAAALARVLHPQLTEAATKRLVERSGGNPFLLEQLAASGEPSDSLRLALAARLRLLSPLGRNAMALLALAGRPLPQQLLGDGAADVLEAGLATLREENVAMRHALFAEAAVAELEPEQRRKLHTQLAQTLEEPGEAARHYAAAGELNHAHTKALIAAEAAVQPAERAAHLELAASCLDGPAAEELKIRAAKALAGTRGGERVLELLAGITPRDPIARADVCLMRYRACRAIPDDKGARAAWSEGIAAAAGTGSVTEIDLRIEEARLAIHVERDFARGCERAAAALRLARARGMRVAAARSLAGVAKLFAGRAGWERSLRSALAHAGDELDGMTELRAASMLVSGFLVDGRPAEASALAAEWAQIAVERHLLAWERVFRVWFVDAGWHVGALTAAAEEAAVLSDEPLHPDERRRLACSHANVLIDLGRLEDARRWVDELLAEVPPEGPVEPALAARASYALSALADLEYWSGRPRDALRATHESLERFGPNPTIDGSAVFLQVTGAWAALDLGMQPPRPVVETVRPLFEAAPVELEAISRLAAGEDDDAARLFERAAELWRGRFSRGEVHCLWAAGEAVRRAGRRDAAVARLEEAEGRAVECGNAAVLGRIRRSLRQAGVRRPAARTRDSTGLTGREAEILELVGSGLSNAEIARRLGLGRPTVVRLIRSAEHKLGAVNRAQAAALAARGYRCTTPSKNPRFPAGLRSG